MRAVKTAIAAIVIASAVVEARAATVAYWNFDEASGPTALDSVGSVNGTLSGGASFASGAGINGSGAILLNSRTNDLVDMGNNFGFVGTSFSIQAWIKTTATTGVIPVSRHQDTVVQGYFLGVNDTGDGGVQPVGSAHFYTTYPTSGQSSALVNDGAWHQLVGVYDFATLTTSIFVDGALESSVSGASLSAANANFSVGGFRSFGGPLVGVFTGLIDEVKVFDTALSTNEVGALYRNTLNPGGPVVPEPTSLALAGFAGIGMAVGAWRRRRQQAA
jgi:hypothetical protein